MKKIVIPAVLLLGLFIGATATTFYHDYQAEAAKKKCLEESLVKDAFEEIGDNGGSDPHADVHDNQVVEGRLWKCHLLGQ